MIRIIEIYKHKTWFFCLLLNRLRWLLSHVIQVCRNISEVISLICLRRTFPPVPCSQGGGERDGCEHPRYAGKEKRKLLFSKQHLPRFYMEARVVLGSLHLLGAWKHGSKMATEFVARIGRRQENFVGKKQTLWNQ